MFLLFPGGWDVLHQFSLSSWDVRKALTLLYSQYSVSPFFVVDVVPDVTDSHKNIIRVIAHFGYILTRTSHFKRWFCNFVHFSQLRPPELGLPNKNYYSLSDRDPVSIS